MVNSKKMLTRSTSKDEVFVEGFPSSWKTEKILNDMLSALKREKLLEKNSRIVISLSGVSAAKIKKLNFKTRRRNKVTDVLSFEQPALGLRGVCFLGDIVICLDAVREQAKEQKHTIKDELCVLIAHGILHLLGFDHEKSMGQLRKMKKLEERILTNFELSSGLISRTT